jgi:hypothetical protein
MSTEVGANVCKAFHNQVIKIKQVRGFNKFAEGVKVRLPDTRDITRRSRARAFLQTNIAY